MVRFLGSRTCAQAKIGYNYTHSQGGLGQDYQKAIDWYEKAVNTKCKDEQCKQCQMSAYHSLAIVYKTRLYPRNEEKAFYWFQRAAENNNASAFKNTAEYYAEGKFVEQDYEKAYYWITRGKGKNVRTSHDDFIAEIKSHLTLEQIRKIDDLNQKFIEELAQKQRNNFANIMDQATMGFNPNAPTAQKANARLAFEIGINKFHYDLEGIKKLIDQGALDAGHVSSNSLLFTAQKMNDLKLVKLLIEEGADINGVDERGFTVLHRAIGYGHTDIALTLINKGANLEDSNDLGDTPLVAAAGKGNLEVVNALIRSGANVHYVEKGNYGEQDALYWALRGGYNQVAKALIEAGAKKGNIHQRYPYDPNAPRKCANDRKECPNGESVSRSGPACKFEMCSETHEESTNQKNIKSTFLEIDTKLSKNAIEILNNGSKKEKDRVIAKIKANPGDYNPAALKALSEVLFSRIEDEEGAFWYMAADLRNREDNLLCETSKSAWKKISFDFSVQQFKPFAELNSAIIQPLLDKVLEWDRTTPYNYDVRWVVIGNGLRGNKLSDPLPQMLCVPENKRDETREFSRNEYTSVVSRYTNGFDYRATPKKLDYLSKDEFKALLDRAKAGDAEAQYKIATVTLTHEHKEFLNDNGQTFRRNWLAVAAKQGHVAAMSRVGSNYLSGYGVPKDERASKIEEGITLLIEAGNKGSFTAHESLGRYYLRQKNPTEAYAWFAMAEHILQKKNPKLQIFPAKKQKMKLEATLSDADLEKAKEKAKEYIDKYGP